ncbi:MAG: hypothetical protein ABR581_10315 [Thermoleophilaceae bacterium]
MAASLAGKAVETLLQLLLVTLVPRVLGPSEYGRFALVLALVTIGSASVSFSGPTVMSRFVPTVEATRRPAVARALLARLARWRALQVLMLGALPGAAVAALVPARVPVWIAALVVGAFALDVAATLVFQVALGLGRAGLWSFRFPVQYGILVLAAVLLDAALGPAAAVGAIAVAAGGTFAVGAATALGPIRRAARDEQVPVGALRFGALQGASGVFSLVATRGCVVVAALMSGSRQQTGFAALAIGVALAGMQVVVQIFAVELPGLAERAGIRAEGARNGLAGAERSALALAWRSEWIVLLLAAAAVFLVEPGLRIAVSRPFAGAADAFYPALGFLVLTPVSALATQAAALRLRPSARLLSTAAGALAFGVTAVLAVPAWEAAGATSAVLVGAAVTNVVSAWLFPDLLRGRLLALSLVGAAVVTGVGALR